MIPPIPVGTASAVKKAAELAATLAAMKLLESRAEKPMREETRVVELPPERAEVDHRGMVVNELDVFLNRMAAGDSLNEAERSRYETLVNEVVNTRGVRRTDRNLGSERSFESGPLADKMVSKVPILGPVAQSAGFIDPRDRMVEKTFVQKATPDIERDVDLETAMSKLKPEDQVKAEELVNRMKKAKPDELASMVEDLYTLQQESGVIDTQLIEKGTLAKAVETPEGKTAGAKALGKRIEEKTLMADYQAAEQGDLKGAALQMVEVKKESVTFAKALEQVEVLTEQAAALALNGKLDEAKEKVAELALVSSNLPENVAKEALISVPKSPNELVNGIERSEGLDASGALNVIGRMDSFSKEARAGGVENADVTNVYVSAMKVKNEMAQEGGRVPSIMEILSNEEGKQRVMALMQQSSAVILEFPGRQYEGRRRAA